MGDGNIDNNEWILYLPYKLRPSKNGGKENADEFTAARSLSMTLNETLLIIKNKGVC
jgi:hypothetical protein